MPVDEDALQFYRRNAEAYAGWATAPSTRRNLELRRLDE
jgi:hypothetical protein